MSNKDSTSMQNVEALAKNLIYAWHASKCPNIYAPYSCTVCKYRELCSKLDELAKVAEK